MNKFFGLVLPYIMLIFLGLMIYVDVAQKLVIESLVIGILSGIWFMCLQRAQGTVLMRTLIILSIVLYIIGAVLGMVGVVTEILPDLIPAFVYLAAMECIGFIEVSLHKPHLSMTYAYSYKNRRRRYF